MSESHDEQRLSRELSAPLLAIYGAGTILGAGIYVLVGEIAAEAGYWVPLAFLIAALAASVNGVVYAELASRAPRAGGPSEYVRRAFGRRWLAVGIGWMIVATGVVSAATITTGFAGYVEHFVDLPGWIPRVALLGLLGSIAVAGARESAWFMAVTTTLGVLGLAFVVYVGFFDAPDPGLSGFTASLPSLSSAGVWTGVVSAGFMAVYAFIGFEDIVHMSEEVEDPGRSLPFAIVTALAVAAVLYVVVSVAAVVVLEPDSLAQESAPLVAVAEEAGYPGWPLGILSLWIIANGALAQVIMASRVIYGLDDLGGAPGFLTRINQRTGTPLRATILATGVALILALFFPLATLASTTSFIILLVFATSNAALIVLERREPDAPFDVPRPVPWIGLVVSLGLAVASLFVGGGH